MDDPAQSRQWIHGLTTPSKAPLKQEASAQRAELKQVRERRALRREAAQASSVTARDTKDSCKLAPEAPREIGAAAV